MWPAFFIGGTKMDFQAITSLIGSLGFPIVVAVYMIWVNKDQSEKHATETKEMTNALNELKIVMQKLIDRLDVKDV